MRSGQCVSALQGRDVTAQGAALGSDAWKVSSPVRASPRAHHVRAALAGLGLFLGHDTHGVALGCHMTAFQASEADGARLVHTASLLANSEPRIFLP